MLQQMRDWFRYLKWILLVIVVMFVWWAFAAWSGGASGGRPQQEEAGWAARVNGTTIDLAAFQSSARQMESTYRSLFGDQFSQQRGLIKIGQAAINQLIDEELLYQGAEAAGLSVSQDEVADAITHEPSLQENGHFIGLDRYRNLFRAARIRCMSHRLESNEAGSPAIPRTLTMDGETDGMRALLASGASSNFRNG